MQDVPRGLPPRHRSRRARHAAAPRRCSGGCRSGSAPCRRPTTAGCTPAPPRCSAAPPSSSASSRDVRRLAARTASTRCSSRAPCRSAWCSPRSSIFVVGQVDDLREVSPPGQDGRHGAGRQHPVDLRRDHPLLPHPVRRAGVAVARPVRAAHRAVGGRHGDRDQLHRRARRPGRRHRRASRRRRSSCTASACTRVDAIGPDNAGPLIAAAVLGACLGFLPYNFHPAKIFMGDAGALLLGLLMAAVTIAVGGNTDTPFSRPDVLLLRPAVHPARDPRRADRRHRLLDPAPRPARRQRRPWPTRTTSTTG